MADLPAAAVVLTQVAVPEALAAACALQGLPVDAVPTPIGSLAREQRDGQISATRWTGGEQGSELSPGLVLDGAPAVVEHLLLGRATAADQPGAVTSVGMSRWRATRTLATISRKVRRAARRAPGAPGPGAPA